MSLGARARPPFRSARLSWVWKRCRLVEPVRDRVRMGPASSLLHVLVDVFGPFPRCSFEACDGSRRSTQIPPIPSPRSLRPSLTSTPRRLSPRPLVGSQVTPCRRSPLRPRVGDRTRPKSDLQAAPRLDPLRLPNLVYSTKCAHSLASTTFK